MDGLKVCLLGPENIMDIHALWKEAALTFHPSGRDAVGRMTLELQDPRTFVAGAFLGEALLGVVLGNDDGRKGWINRLAVRPAYQKQGVGHALVDFCERRFKGRGLGMVCCLIEEGNEPSRSLFLKEDYEERQDIHYFRKMIGGEDW
jgi:GNAT superfamily N-acetyltransferase